MKTATERIAEFTDRLRTDEPKVCARITALVRRHDQRQVLYGKNFDNDLDQQLRQMFGMEEDL